jgi:hypothetical protein
MMLALVCLRTMMLALTSTRQVPEVRREERLDDIIKASSDLNADISSTLEWAKDVMTGLVGEHDPCLPGSFGHAACIRGEWSNAQFRNGTMPCLFCLDRAHARVQTHTHTQTHTFYTILYTYAHTHTRTQAHTHTHITARLCALDMSMCF